MTGRERRLAVVTAVVLGTLACQRFLVRPLSDFRAARVEESRRLERSLGRARRLWADRARIDVDFERTFQRRAAAGHAEGWLDEVAGLARRSGVRIRDLRPEPRPGDRRRRVGVRTDSDWTALSSFLQSLQSSPRLFTVEQATIDAAPSGGLAARLLLIEEVVDDENDSSWN
jgi:hypothetical protein